MVKFFKDVLEFIGAAILIIPVVPLFVLGFALSFTVQPAMMLVLVAIRFCGGDEQIIMAIAEATSQVCQAPFKIAEVALTGLIKAFE